MDRDGGIRGSRGTGNVHGIIVGGQVSPVNVRSDLTSSILKDR